MKREYIDIIFKAVDLKDVELLVFVLSKDINKDVFKSLAGITYRDNKNVYEYLLLKEKNEMLIAFIEFGFWAHVHMPINKHNETLLDMAYRVKNLPVLISLLSNENAGYSASDANLKVLVDKLKAEYQTSAFLLGFINQKVMPVEYPEELTEDKVHLSSQNSQAEEIVLTEEMTSVDPDYSVELSAPTETVDAEDVEYTDWGQKADRFVLKLRDVLKNAFSPLSSSSPKNYKTYPQNDGEHSGKMSDDLNHEDGEYTTVEEPTEEIDTASHKSYYEEDRAPTTKEIKDKIRGRNQNFSEKELDGLLRGFSQNHDAPSDIIRVDFKAENYADLKKTAGFNFDFSDFTFKNKKERVAFVVRKIIDTLSLAEFKQYATAKNFVVLLHDNDIQTVPKIESYKLSSLDFVYDHESFTLSSLENISMEEIRNTLYIRKEDDIFFVNQKVTYLENINNKNKEYLRLLIAKALLASNSMIEFLQKLKSENIAIETSIKDFELSTASDKDIENVSSILSIYTYKKDDLAIDDESLPEQMRFSEIKDMLTK